MLRDNPEYSRVATPHDPATAVIRMHVWLEGRGGVVFGMGRLLLLEAVQHTGSLKAAAESLNMSYRAAWGKLKSTEKALGRDLLEKAGGNKSGYRLSPYGKELARRFRRWFEAVEEAAQEKAEGLFEFPTAPFETREDKADREVIC